MRSLWRNKQLIFYSSLSEDDETTDEWGNPCKEYDYPMPYRISVSANVGEVTANGFGTNLDYDRTMVTTDLNCPIDEYTHIWIGADPEDEPYNYVVKKKAVSLNQVLYAIKKVEVSPNEES